MAFTAEQSRQLQNLIQFYETWKEVSQQLARLPGGMYWKVVNSKEYLYKQLTSAGIRQATSIGPRSEETEGVFADFKGRKATLLDRVRGIELRINEAAPLVRALNLPAVDELAGRLLRALDQIDAIGKQILVIGTYAVTAYEIAARDRFAAGLEATDDLDFTILVGTRERPADADLPRRLLLALREVDRSFIVSNSPKTIVNKSGYRVDLLMSKNLAQAMEAARPWKPQMLPGQEWLLLGEPLEQVVVDFSGWPVPIAAPDPRYFALHKLWLSEQPDRVRSGRSPKDSEQGKSLVEAIRAHMPHYPLNEEFRRSLPAPLRRFLS
jgi:hypothetical protein